MGHAGNSISAGGVGNSSSGSGSNGQQPHWAASGRVGPKPGDLAPVTPESWTRSEHAKEALIIRGRATESGALLPPPPIVHGEGGVAGSYLEIGLRARERARLMDEQARQMHHHQLQYQLQHGASGQRV